MPSGSHRVAPQAKSRKQFILEYSREHDLNRIGPREIQEIEEAVRRQFSPKNKVSPSYIANVLRQAGARVEVDSPYVDPWMEPPYADRLGGVLRFHNLDEAESALRRLNDIYQEYRKASDRVGTSLVRALVLKGKTRAESLASNPRVSLEKRREKQEIAHWFKVWLDLSDLFFDWLEMRKNSEEFQRLLANRREKQSSPQVEREA